MEIKTFKLCFDIGGKLSFHEVKKIIYGKTEYNDDIFKLEIHDSSIVKDISTNIVYYKSKNYYDNFDESIIDLQKQLSDYIKITCCQSCKFGNYCIYSNSDNEIFCLIDFPPKNKLDLAEIFSEHYDELQINESTHLCEKYQRASKEDNYYTYNSWSIYF